MNENVYNYLLPLQTYFTEQNYSQERLTRAFEVADRAHSGQTRKSGEPYIIHPLIVADYLCAYRADEATVLAAIMHDVVEDSDTALDEIRHSFGDEVAYLVDGVTKLGNIPKSQDKDVQALRKLFQMMSDDLRMVVIKLFDRLHNMRTLGSLPPYKQEQKLTETQNIYIPLAEKLNVWPAVCALEDLCLQYFQPDVFETISQHYENNKAAFDEKKQHLKQLFREKLRADREKIQDIFIGQYSFTEISRKKDIAKNLSMFDTHYIQVVVKNMQDCYTLLGSIHSQFRPRNHELQDFMAFPKENGYKAIQTRVFTPYGPIEVHLHTKESYYASQYSEIFSGINTKESHPSSRWIESILNANNEVLHDLDFQTIVQQEILGDTIKVYSIDGEEDKLPVGSIVLDYVAIKYPKTFPKIQSVKINGRKRNLLHPLTQNNILDIVFSDTAQPLDITMIAQAKQHTTRRILEQHLEDSITLDQVYAGIEICTPWFAYFGIPSFSETNKNYFVQNPRELVHTLNAIGAQTLSIENFFDTCVNLEYTDIFKKIEEGVYRFIFEVTDQDQNSNTLEDILNLWETYSTTPQTLDYKFLKNGMWIKLNFKNISEIIRLKKALDNTQKYQHKLIPYFNF